MTQIQYAVVGYQSLYLLTHICVAAQADSLIDLVFGIALRSNFELPATLAIYFVKEYRF